MRKLLLSLKNQKYPNSTVKSNIWKQCFCQLTKTSNFPSVKENKNELTGIQQQSLIDDAEKYKIYENSALIVEKELGIKEIEGHSELLKQIKDVINSDNQENFLKKTGIVVLTKEDLFFKSGLDTHNYLRKYRDRDYEVDVKEVLTRDLYEKQRVIDPLVESNKNEIKKLISGYEKEKYKKYVDENRFVYLIYKNPYPEEVIIRQRDKLHMRLLLNFLGSAVSAIIFPPLLLLFLRQYIKIYRGMNFFRSLVNEVYLSKSKQKAYFNTYNALGFQVRPDFSKEIDISTISILKDRYINNNKSFFWSKIMKSKTKDIDNYIKDNKFQIFYQINSSLGSFLIPEDSSEQAKETSEELILLVLNGEIEKLVNFDYTEFENDSMQLYRSKVSRLKEYYKVNFNQNFESDEERLEKLYSKYYPNSNFAEYDQQYLLKDKSNGYYVDNGYR